MRHFTLLEHLSTLFHMPGLLSAVSSLCCFFASGDITFGMDLNLAGKPGGNWPAGLSY